VQSRFAGITCLEVGVGTVLLDDFADEIRLLEGYGKIGCKKRGPLCLVCAGEVMDDAVAPKHKASCKGFVSQVFVFGATRYLLMLFTLLSESSRFTLSQSDCFTRLPLSGPPGK
jgi:hypothetical protein